MFRTQIFLDTSTGIIEPIIKINSPYFHRNINKNYDREINRFERVSSDGDTVLMADSWDWILNIDRVQHLPYANLTL